MLNTLKIMLLSLLLAALPWVIKKNRWKREYISVNNRGLHFSYLIEQLIDWLYVSKYKAEAF